MSLLETCAALFVSSVAAVSVFSGLQPLSCAVKVEAARTVLFSALLEARREAYRLETTTSAETSPGSGEVVLRPSGAVRRLGDGVTVASAPSDGSVDFRPTGLADNATVVLSCAASSASVVVNQRGVIR